MEKRILELFKQYKPIKSIYENSSEYICLPDVGKNSEPLAVYYDKKMGKLIEKYFFEDNSIADDIETSELIFGEELDFEAEL